MRLVPVGEWGRDHWSVLAYVETRCVDFKGVLDKDHMRTNALRHPGLVGPKISMSALAKRESFQYPTRLRGDGKLQVDHDNWDCLYDLEEAGLIIDAGTGINPRAVMTPKGAKLAGELRAWKAAGGSFSTFEPSPPA